MSMSRWEKFTEWVWRKSPYGRGYIAGRRDGEDATHDAIERQGVAFKLGDVVDKDATQAAWCRHCNGEDESGAGRLEIQFTAYATPPARTLTWADVDRSAGDE